MQPSERSDVAATLAQEAVVERNELNRRQAGEALLRRGISHRRCPPLGCVRHVQAEVPHLKLQQCTALILVERDLTLLRSDKAETLEHIMRPLSRCVELALMQVR